MPDKNGAGIRLDGTGITIQHCYFHDCEDGILTSNPEAGNILIEYSEFAYCGYGNGYSHNLYIGHVNSFTFRFNYSHHCNVGHCVKSRAQNNFIYYNFIADEDDGYSSRLIDLPNGGFTIVKGNVLMQGAQAINGNAFGYGLEGLANEAPHELYVVNNTFVNKRNGARFVSAKAGSSVVNLQNNIFAGGGTVLEGTATTLSNNLVEENISEVLFNDVANFNYKLTTGSPAIDLGVTLNSVNEFSLSPEFSYIHPLESAERNISGKLDAGAYEYEVETSVQYSIIPHVFIYPNPVQDKLYIKNTRANDVITLYNSLGKKLKEVTADEGFSQLNSGDLSNGVYILKLSDGSNRFTGTFIKK